MRALDHRFLFARACRASSGRGGIRDNDGALYVGGAIGSGKIERLIEFTESRRRVILNEAAHVIGKDGKLVWCVACVGGKI